MTHETALDLLIRIADAIDAEATTTAKAFTDQYGLVPIASEAGIHAVRIIATALRKVGGGE